MVNNELGDSTGDTESETVEAGADITQGDALAINQSATDQRYPIAEPGNSNDANLDVFAGVAAENITSGNRGKMYLGGEVIAFVNSSVSHGVDLDLGDASTGGIDAGELDESDGGPVLALSSEGGTDTAGSNLDAGEAEVYF